MDRLDRTIRRQLARFEAPAGLGEILAAWPDVAGPQIARNASARLGRDGTLLVATASSAWAFELAQRAPELTARLAVALGAAAPPRLRFAPGPLPEPEPEVAAEAAREPVRTGPIERRAAAALVADLDDVELRELIARAAAASLAMTADGRRF